MATLEAFGNYGSTSYSGNRVDSARRGDSNGPMISAPLPTILEACDGPPAEVLNPGGRAGICLVCEHASSSIPSSLSGLGLSPNDRQSHAVWDAGAKEYADHIAEILIVAPSREAAA